MSLQRWWRWCIEQKKTHTVSSRVCLWCFCNPHSRIRGGLVHTLAACGAGRSTPNPSPIEPLPEACCTGKRYVLQIASSPSLYRVIGWHLRSPKQVAGLDKHILAARGHRRDLWVSTSVRVCRFGLKSDKLRLHCVFSFWLVYATDLAVAGCCRPAPEREREREREREKMCVCVWARARERAQNNNNKTRV